MTTPEWFDEPVIIGRAEFLYEVDALPHCPSCNSEPASIRRTSPTPTREGFSMPGARRRPNVVYTTA